MNRRAYIGAVGCALLGLSGCASRANDEPSPTLTPDPTPTAASSVEILENQYKYSPYPGVYAAVRNNSKYTLGNIHLTATFFDSEGSKIEEHTTDVSDVSPGEVVVAIVPYPDRATWDRVEDYELVVNDDRTWYDT